MLDNLKKYKVILASNSPRRKELLSGLGVDYEIRTLPDVDESYPDTLRGADIPLYIAKEKANAYRNMLQSGELMITADTIVWLDGKVLGKPKDREDALCMLRDMSGRTHEVFTGVCITTTEWQRSFSAQTEVRFSKLSEEEIIYYVDKFQPMDKAGAYGVQEWIGFIGVENISGSYYNIMGLPWSPNEPERFRRPSTEVISSPLVCHSGAPLQTSSQEKALRPTSSASTARRL